MTRNAFRRGLDSLASRFGEIAARSRDRELAALQANLLGLQVRIEQAKRQGLWRKSKFNLFQVLGYRRLEDAHSRMLRWLLDPDEAHGLGDSFLRALLRVVTRRALPPGTHFRVTPEWQEGTDRPDLVVEATSTPWWLVIENKIGGFEQPDQTVRYAERFCRKGQLGRNVFLIFLTPDRRKAASPRFTPMRYRCIGEILSGLSAENEAGMMINHLVDHIHRDLESLS